MNRSTMIYIVRHGETDWNAQHLMQGQTDVPLNEKGRTQAKAIANHLKDIEIDVLYASPLLRTMETAAIINEYHHLPIVREPAIMERHFGILEGKTYDEVNAYHPGLIFSEIWNYPNFKPPMGESVHEVRSRASVFVERLKEHDKGKSVLVVSHGDVLRSIIGALLHVHPKTLLSVYSGNASLALIELREGREPMFHLANYQAPTKT